MSAAHLAPLALPISSLPRTGKRLPGKRKRLPVNNDKPELTMTLLGHPALVLLEKCRAEGWADNSAETVAAFKRGVQLKKDGPLVSLFSFAEHDMGRKGGQHGWAVGFDSNAKLNKECRLVGANTGRKRDASKAVLKLNKPHAIRLGLNDLCSDACSVTYTFHMKVGGVKGGSACKSWDEVFAEGAVHVEVELKHGVRILLKAHEEEEGE